MFLETGCGGAYMTQAATTTLSDVVTTTEDSNAVYMTSAANMQSLQMAEGSIYSDEQ